MVIRTLLIPLLPLFSFAAIIFFGKHLKEKSAWLAISASTLSCLLAFSVIVPVLKGSIFQASFQWLSIQNLPIEFGFFIDPLTAMMLFVVTFIGTLIIIYSVGYMHGDNRYPRFFAYLSLFMFSMLGLVLSSTLVQIYIFWELVGLCSYFLIGFWFEKKSAAEAGRKAFITNRIGDVGFFLGIATFFVATGTIRFADIRPELFTTQTHSFALTLAAILLFCGAIGKSAQFPLHVWLPDAMEGPTPVSALIHAATMVAAGVYLVIRLFPLVQAFPIAAETVAVIGTTTAVLGAFFALTQFDIKKVLAYSTISQLGFMIAALGVGGFAGGSFHLMTHAFFKALLFLGAGSVIHGSGVQDMREMGALRKSMPITFWTFLIATIAIAGIPPFAGFWSKDEILLSALTSRHTIIFYILALVSLMTSFYMFRLVFMTFFGVSKSKHHAHESPFAMTIPLIILAAASATIGLPGSPFMHHWFQKFIGVHEEIHMNLFVVGISVFAALGGLLISFFFYIVKPGLPKLLSEKLGFLYSASKNKLWFDELYQASIIKWFKDFANFAFRFDGAVIDRAVNEVGLKTAWTSRLKNWIDQHIVDGAVNLVGGITRTTSSIFRFVQTGFIHNYLFVVILGILIILYSTVLN